ncbi:SDR family NAD(P)-dependent oxidoreductase [Micrococcus lylae]|uniref:SDR family oxidoreductase n=1 Tax=Micrococcus lylae TaxID=1273 RepID=A0ABY2K3M1_9MICC|nr:SDR family oxidoreductase [Micrococcus lylae]TFI01096.1 SDR family oxidoreductase [Micrococcus lylae]WIK82257.1 SDR family oxidoreductase [Micrococcus lylae]
MTASRYYVIGAASGIGGAVHTSLAATGAEVLGLDLNPNDDVVRFDVTAEEDWNSLDLNDCKGLVITSGIRKPAPLAKTSLDDWRDVMDINVTGAFLGLRRLAQVCDGGYDAQGLPVVLVSSAVTSKTVSGQASYNTSKGAIDALVRSAALELAPYGVRVNSVNPGSIRTPMTADGWNDESHANRMRAEIPAGRAGTAEEVAAVIISLLRPEFGYVTGSSWRVDGGWSL